jgi:phospholipid/cholesterol/gamma-HCH transport system substrate-binding protein
MERDANYVAVGAFILLVIAMGVGFIVWYSDASDGREYDLYEISFAGSVSGLERNNPVRYLGVDVGRVRKMSIDRQRPGRVIVVAEIDRTAPISSATRASLGWQGVTGQLYVDLRQAVDADASKPLAQGDNYPLIDSVASDFDTFLASLPELMSRANSLLERVGRVLSDQNLTALSTTMNNLSNATAGLPETTRNVGELVKQMSTTVVEIRGAAEGLRGMVTETRPELRIAIEKIGVVADNLAQASQRIDHLAQQSEVQIGHFTEHGLFEMERLVRETRSAAREFRDLSRSLQDNPSQILYEPPVSGVEIAK